MIARGGTAGCLGVALPFAPPHSGQTACMHMCTSVVSSVLAQLALHLHNCVIQLAKSKKACHHHSPIDKQILGVDNWHAQPGLCHVSIFHQQAQAALQRHKKHTRFSMMLCLGLACRSWVLPDDMRYTMYCCSAKLWRCCHSILHQTRSLV